MARSLGRVVLWLVVVGGVLATLLFFGAAASYRDGRLETLIVGLVTLAITVGAFFGQRALRTTRRRDDGHAASEQAPRRAPVEIPPGDDVLVLRPGRRKWILVGLTCGTFTAILVALLLTAPGLLVVFGLLFFGAGTAVSVLQLVPGAAYLRIGPQGFVAKGPLRTISHPWDEVEHFQVFEVSTQYSTQSFVGFDLRDRVPSRQSFWQTMSRGMSGVDCGLPDNYGRDPQELADLLADYRERYATVGGPSPSERADRELAAAAASVATSRRPVVTSILTLVCLGVFAVAAAAHGIAPTADELEAAGGISAHALGEGRWWTLLSANVLHANVVHLGLNLVALAIAGFLLERELGAARVLALVLAAGLASMATAVLLTPGDVTVGVSGIVFALLTWAVVRDPHRTRALGSFGWSLLPIGVIYTFLTPGTSIGAHLGGLLAGLVLGRWFERDPDRGSSAPAQAPAEPHAPAETQAAADPHSPAGS